MSTVSASVAITHLYRDHHGWLHAWLRKKMGCAHQAADLAHDTFVRVIASYARTSPADLREPRAYLTTVAGRILLNHYRRLSLERAWLAALACLPEDVSPSPEERVLILEALHEIDAVLDRLAPRARTAFLLAQLEGLTYAEIALQLHISSRTVKRYMAQAFEEFLVAGV